MGTYGFDDHHDYIAGLCRLRVDREVGQPFNRYLVFVQQQPMIVDEVSKPQADSLFSAAAAGQMQFNGVASNLLPSWGQLSGIEKEDVWKAFTRSAQVDREVAVERGQPHYFSPGPPLSAVDDDDLRAAAKTQGRPAFETLASSLLSPWWSQIPADAQHWFFNCYADE